MGKSDSPSCLRTESSLFLVAAGSLGRHSLYSHSLSQAESQGLAWGLDPAAVSWSPNEVSVFDGSIVEWEGSFKMTNSIFFVWSVCFGARVFSVCCPGWPQDPRCKGPLHLSPPLC